MEPDETQKNPLAIDIVRGLCTTTTDDNTQKKNRRKKNPVLGPQDTQIQLPKYSKSAGFYSIFSVFSHLQLNQRPKQIKS